MGEERGATDLHVLYVEDSDDDFSLVEQALKAVLPAVRLGRSVEAEDALQRLVAGPSSCDLLLADHRLPGMSGLELCRQVRDRGLSVPLVVLTGAGSEELVVEALEAGVDDYLIKDVHRTYLKVLPVVLPKVVARHRERLARKRAEEDLRRAHEKLEQRVRERTTELMATNEQLRREIQERTRVEDSLREAEQKYRTLVEQAHDAIVILQDGRIVYHNPICEDLLGSTVEETRSRDFLDFVAPEDRGQVREHYFRRLRGEAVPSQYEVGVLTRSGERLTMEVKPRVIECHGRPAIMVVMRDITVRKRAEESLRASEAEKKAILDASMDRIRLVDQDLRIIWANQKTARDIKTTPDQLIGRRCYEVYLDEKSPCAGCPTAKAFASGQVEHAVMHQLKSKDGRGELYFGETYWEGYAVPLKDELGTVVRVIQIFRNITAKTRAQEDLRRSKEFLDNIIDALDDPVFVKDEQHRWVILNHRACELMGRPRQELIGKTDHDLFPKEQADVFWEKDALVLATGETNINEEEITWHGVLHTISTKKSLLIDSVTGRKFIVGTIRDITESKRAEGRLHRYQAQLRSLASELSRTEERERRRLATDLHDAIGQNLAMAKLRLDGLRSNTKGVQSSAEFDEVARLLGQAIQDTRSLTFELSPPVLYELGLEAALESLVERMQHAHDIQIDFSSDGGSYSLGEDLSVFCFRAVQELLINVVKHARTRQARICLSREGATLKIIVLDHGVGFVPGTMPNHADQSSGFGLFSIEERVRHFGGHLEVDSRRGRGTRVTLLIPLSPPS
jgi:PAS domain S-box-containing protein